MSNYPYTYNTIAGAIEHGIQFLFVSRGKVNIIKAVRYVYALDLKGKPVYNLAFGDYDLRTDTFIDDQISNNGDTYRVFHTVLSTIPHFFSVHPDAMMMVWGSDSTKSYQENCHLSCKTLATFTLNNIIMKIKGFENDPKISKMSEEEILALAMKQINGRDLAPHRTAQGREILKNIKLVPWKK
ncbi:MAG TPA: hypothetical protein VGS79_19595 [Puia sp.]|nr:hypothetical protein [Puia sp.]